jgi:hypothetical protein
MSEAEAIFRDYLAAHPPALVPSAA